MNTRQHTLLTFLAMLEKNHGQYDKTLRQFYSEVPFILMPDGIRCFGVPRSCSHFTKRISQDEILGLDSMVFPELNELKTFSAESAKNCIHHFDALVANVDEASDLSELIKTNRHHTHLPYLKAHLVQDIVMDYIFREYFVDVSQRYEGKYRLISGKEISVEDMRKALHTFEDIAFMSLAKAFYHKTGIFPDNEWFDNNVLKPLKETENEIYALNTYKFMRISEQDCTAMHNQIWVKDKRTLFTPTSEQYDAIVTQLYVMAFTLTLSVISS